MAYRRKLGVTKASTFKEEIYHQNTSSPSEDDDNNDHTHKHNQIVDENERIRSKRENEMLAAKAIRASAAHRDSSAYGYAYATPAVAASAATNRRHSDHFRSLSFPKGSNYESPSMTDSDDPKYGFWGILARKAKSILEEDNQFESSSKNKPQVNDTATVDQMYQSRQSSESGAKVDNAKIRKRFDAITSSLNNFGDTLGNAFEEGRTIMEHKTADIIQETRNRTADFIQETRKLQLRRRGGSSDGPDQATVVQNTSWQRPVAQPVQTNTQGHQETQLKASRDVAMATAAKAKVLLRELKTVKADLAFAKERCAQLEEENKRLRENREKGDNPDDDDLIRLQLETLLAEKARLAHENSIYARENRFLREIVEYHQLTMQDVVYLDEGAEEVTEVYPFPINDGKVLSSTPTSPTSTKFLPENSSLDLPPEKKEHTSEVPKDVYNVISSFPSSVCQTSDPPAGTRSSEVLVSSQLGVDEKTEASCYRELPIAADEAPKRPSVSSP
ncbi:hypothetical protein RDABS01_024812 [Bienertia sinuspersici]